MSGTLRALPVLALLAVLSCRTAPVDRLVTGSAASKARRGALQTECALGPYAIRIFSGRAGDTLEIARAGRVVHTLRGSRLEVDPWSGRDATGDGREDLVIDEWTGGAHGRRRVHVFLVEDPLAALPPLDGGDGDLSGFEDVDGDGRPEFVTNDWTFAGWHASFADSPAPAVYLRYEDGAFRLAASLMRREPPPEDELDAYATVLREDRTSWAGARPSSTLWSVMLDLVYSGHPALAWRFLDRAWRPDIAGKAEFLDAFRARLVLSPYGSEIERLGR